MVSPRHELRALTASLFSEVKANEVAFDRNGIIRGIRGTKFDFEGEGRVPQAPERYA
ncbi:MAG: hypothetical protein KAG62_02645 [Caulobacter sp.]|jgi:hypothetical protein|nr:hypothetical protein [Caulobacter sp.]